MAILQSLISNSMILDSAVVNGHERSEIFANFFERKVHSITENTSASNGISQLFLKGNYAIL